MTNEHKELISGLYQNNLIDTQIRGNTAMGGGLEPIENTKKLSRHPACEVRISFAEKPNEAVIADVLRMLMNTGPRR